MSFERKDGRSNGCLRPIHFEQRYTRHAEGSVLVSFGETRVLCTASVASGVPPFLKNSGKGWLTAEYGMLPRATHERTAREATRGKQVGRTMEIQRLIGRSLRTCVNLKALGEHTVTIDCDVLQADGGTRTAAITGACLALADALSQLERRRSLASGTLFLNWVAAVSVGLLSGNACLDLNYDEDSSAETDLNVVMSGSGGFVELQGTAEKGTFNALQLHEMLALAERGVATLMEKQRAAFSELTA